MPRNPRQVIEDSYAIRDERIVSPGKFEGQPLYVPYFWSAALDGCADRDDGEAYGFDIIPEDRELFPEIPKRRRAITLIEDEQGSVTSDH